MFSSPLPQTLRVVLMLSFSARRSTAFLRTTARGRAPTAVRAAPVSTPDLSERLRSLAEDATRVARETGARAVAARTVQGQRAIVETLLELRNDLPAPPPPSTLLDAARAASAARSSGGDAAAAFAKPLLEWGEKNVPEELFPRIFRKMSEKLGATYVKLGQFVASSPTLFPAPSARRRPSRTVLARPDSPWTGVAAAPRPRRG